MQFYTDQSTLLRIANSSKTSCAEIRDGQRNGNWCSTSPINTLQPLSTARTQFIYSSGNTALASMETFTSLGVLIHNSLSYKEHINNTLRKASRTLYAIMRAPKGASQQAKRTAFFSVCLPLLEYASEIWNPHLRYLVQDLESINRNAFRWACRFGKYEHISSAMEEFNWPTLENRRKLKYCHTLEKILAHNLEVNYKLFTPVNASHNTRRANIRHTINTDAMKHSFFNRTMEFQHHLFFKSHSFSILSLIFCHLLTLGYNIPLEFLFLFLIFLF